MKDDYAIARFEQATALLPNKWCRLARQLSDQEKQCVEELRLRTGYAMTALLPEGELCIGDGSECIVPADLEQLCDKATEYSRYAASNTIAQGFVTAQGGFRVGLCGTVITDGAEGRTLRLFSSAVIRIGREKIGLSESILPQLYEEKRFCSTVIIAPPGAGKTTFLRDLVRAISDGTEITPPQRVGLVDERGEIAAMYHGRAQFSIGCRTDVLDGCPKAIGMEMLLRAVNPQVIAADEITSHADLERIAQAANCGVAMLVTLHAQDVRQAKRKPLFNKLLRMHVFERAVCIIHQNRCREYKVETL